MSSQKIKQTVDNTPPIESKVRRSLLNGLWLALSGLALAEIAWLVGSFLKPLQSTDSSVQAADIIDAGPVDRFAPNSVTAFPPGRFYLACLEDGGFLALSRRCTHLGCKPNIPLLVLANSIYRILGQIVLYGIVIKRYLLGTGG